MIEPENVIVMVDETVKHYNDLQMSCSDFIIWQDAGIVELDHHSCALV